MDPPTEVPGPPHRSGMTSAPCHLLRNRLLPRGSRAGRKFPALRLLGSFRLVNFHLVKPMRSAFQFHAQGDAGGQIRRTEGT